MEFIRNISALALKYRMAMYKKNKGVADVDNPMKMFIFRQNLDKIN